MDQDTKNWLYDFHKDAYKFQLEQTEKMRDRISFLVGLLTPLGGAVVYVVWNQSLDWSDCSALFLAIPPAGAVAYLGTAVVYGLMALRSQVYTFIPSTLEAQEFAEKLSAIKKLNPQSTFVVLDEVKFKFADRYRDAASHNFWINRRRSDWLHHATQCGIFSFCFLVVALPRFVYVKASEKPRPTTVVIERPVQVTR